MISNKKTVLITLILLIELMSLVSCTSTTVELSNNLQPNQKDIVSEPEHQQKIESNKIQQKTIPQINTEDSEIELPMVNSFFHLTEFEEIGTTETTYNITQLLLNKPVLFNLHGILVKLEVIDFKSNDPNYEHKLYNKDKTQHWIVNDWAKIKINDDKIDTFPDEEMVKVELTNGDIVYVAAAMISDDNVLIFVADKLK